MKPGYLFFKSLLFVFTFIFVSNLYAVIPAGYYHFAKNKSKDALKTALKNTSSPLKVLDYGSGPGFTWQGFYSTDRRSDSTVIDMYSLIVRKQTSYAAVDGLHIEHSLPKSWWGAHENMAYKDLFHLYPADAVTNMTKSNLPLGEVTGAPTLDNGVSKVGKNGFGTVYAENCFEPADQFKGDFARSYFYISSIYEDFSTLWQSPMMNNNTYPVWKPWAIDLLLKWHRQDPVSSKEMERNESIFKIQSNRNPFIDYPALAEYIWGEDTTTVFPFPNETQAFFTSPRRGTTIDFGILMTNNSRSSNLHIEGVNFTGNVGLALKNNIASLRLSASNLLNQGIANGVDVDVFFEPTSDGVVRDTLILSGGGLTTNFEVPIVANAVSDFIVLEPTQVTPVGGKLQWISHPSATDYRLTLFQPEQKAGDLIISAYVEGSSWNKAIEIYNGTGKIVDLSKYALRKQSNGDGSFGSVLKLNGQLLSGSTYTIVHKSATNATLLSKYNLLTDTLLQINGNDALALTRSGLIIDMVGQANAGAEVIWGLDVTLQRKNLVTHPISVFNKNEWKVLPLDSVAFIGAHSMSFLLSEPVLLKQLNTGNITNYNVTDLNPGSKYTYSVEAIKQDGIIGTINTMQLHTSALSAPEILAADSVKSDGFITRWEKDIYADSYLIDVFSMSGSAETTVSEGFDNVGSGGTPLPTGWTSSSISTYTSATSTGVAIPSITLNDNADWLMTKTYDAPVTKLTFMYRFPSGATGSSLLLEALQNGQWATVATIPAVNSNKAYPAYDFTTVQNYRQFRFSYTKTSGNLAIDDVKVTYGKPDTSFVYKGKLVADNYFQVAGLLSNTTYFYRVKSKRGYALSPYSEIVGQKTSVLSKNGEVAIQKAIFIKFTDVILIKNLKLGNLVSLFDSTGRCVYRKRVNSDEQKIPVSHSGIYIIHLQTETGIQCFKILF
jgi:hypothetical protein